MKNKLTKIEQHFYQNVTFLVSTFDFERLGDQLYYIAECSDSFHKPIPQQLRNKASILYKHLTKNGYFNKNIKRSIIYIQSINLINIIYDYLLEANQKENL